MEWEEESITDEVMRRLRRFTVKYGKKKATTQSEPLDNGMNPLDLAQSFPY